MDTGRRPSVLARAIVTGLLGAACNAAGVVSSTSAPTPSATLAPTPLARPVDYVLPAGCDLVGSGELRNVTTYWQVKCSAPGLVHTILTPSLASQGWEPCGFSNNRAYFRTATWLITVSTLDSSEPRELSEMARSSGCGNLPGG